MKFKVTKIATAVAAGLGLSAIGLSAAHADRIMFPYVGGSATVTSIITVVNSLAPALIPGGRLHYQIFHKSGNNATNAFNTSECVEDSVFRGTSANDIVTFDLTGHFGDANGILFEPSSVVNYAGSFALLKPILAAVPEGQPKIARGWLMVDNQGSPISAAPSPETLYGEALLIDFVEGAAWGYVAYNPATGANPYDFSDAAETEGEVIAGSRQYTPAQLRSGVIGHSPRVPVSIYPLVNGDITSQFMVTPINHDVVVAPVGQPAAILPAISNRPGQLGQNTTNLTSRIGLSVLPPGSALIAFNRDEQAIDGTAGANVTCVGAVKLNELFSPLAQSQLGNGGWTGVRVTSPGRLTTVPPALPTAITAANTTRTLFTNEAVVMKLEYNLSGQFLTGQNFKGAFNNADWMRRGARESIALYAGGANVQLPFAASTMSGSSCTPSSNGGQKCTATIEKFYDQLGFYDTASEEYVDVGPGFVEGETISFVQ